jgi:hypothetical protein
MQEVGKVASSVHVQNRRKGFVADGTQGILCVSSTSPDAARPPFFGFGDDWLRTGRPTRILAVVAAPEPVGFVIPVEAHRDLMEGLSRDESGNRKFHVAARAGRYWMIGRRDRIEIDRYRNRFDLFASPR